ncbi:hypothetical protein, partial [Mycobacterium tuberculosis]
SPIPSRVATASDAEVPADRIVNTWPADTLLAWTGSH